MDECKHSKISNFTLNNGEERFRCKECGMLFRNNPNPKKTEVKSIADGPIKVIEEPNQIVKVETHVIPREDNEELQRLKQQLANQQLALEELFTIKNQPVENREPLGALHQMQRLADECEKLPVHERYNWLRAKMISPRKAFDILEAVEIREKMKREKRMYKLE